MNDQELLPCPFCGNDVKGYESEDDSGGYGPYLEYRIHCYTPNCFLSDEKLYCSRDNKNEFISKWNSRYRQRVHKLNQL